VLSHTSLWKNKVAGLLIIFCWKNSGEFIFTFDEVYPMDLVPVLIEKHRINEKISWIKIKMHFYFYCSYYCACFSVHYPSFQPCRINIRNIVIIISLDKVTMMRTKFISLFLCEFAEIDPFKKKCIKINYLSINLSCDNMWYLLFS